MKEELRSLIGRSPYPDANLSVNTKDQGGGMYLAPFGTSLGKSDCGAVGRGNRQEGYIAAFRPANIEAPAGKNPLHHAGKIYTLAAQQIADQVFGSHNVNTATAIVARNGDALTQPAHIHVELERAAVPDAEIHAIATETLEHVSLITEDLLATEPVAATRAAADAHDSALLETV